MSGDPVAMPSASANGTKSSLEQTEGGVVACPDCQRINPSARRFCGGCGQSLWEKCPQCQVELAADERFCGGCGVDIHAAHQQQQQEAQRRIDEALALAVEHRYELAISTLAGLAASTDARLVRYSARALELTERFEAEFEQRKAAAATALQQARASLEACDYDAAQSLLEAVPPSLRSDQHELLLKRAGGCKRELADLLVEIRAALEQKQSGGLLTKLDRVLALQPSHAQARKLAERLRDSLLKAAKASFQQQDYRQALDQLDQIPLAFRNEKFESLHDAATELQAMLVAVHTAAVADKTLVALADRLCKLAPANREAAELRDRAARQAAQRPAEPLAAPGWAAAPPRLSLGAPIDWRGHFTRPAVATQAIAQTLREHPGQFFTALGLALQGVGLAALDIHLTPQDKAGVLGRLPTLGLGRRHATAAWGIDLGDFALRAIKLVRDNSDAVRLDACEFIPHAQPLTHVDVTKRGELADQTLQAFAARIDDLQATKVCVGISGQRVLGRFFELPPMPAKKIADAVPFQLKGQIPIPLDELCWSFHAFGESGAVAGSTARQVLVQASRQMHVRDRLHQFQSAGIRVDFVQSDCLALYNALAYDVLPADESGASAAIAAIDVGAEATNIVVAARNLAWFRTVGLGGESFTRALGKQLQLASEEAERLKRKPAKARRYSQWHEALAPIFAQLQGEAERSLSSYANLHPQCPVRHVYGLGGAFPTWGLLAHLRAGP